MGSKPTGRAAGTGFLAGCLLQKSLSTARCPGCGERGDASTHPQKSKWAPANTAAHQASFLAIRCQDIWGTLKISLLGVTAKKRKRQVEKRYGGKRGQADYHLTHLKCNQEVLGAVVLYRQNDRLGKWPHQKVP